MSAELSNDKSKHDQESLKHLLFGLFTKMLNILDSEARRAESAREVHGAPLSVLLEGAIFSNRFSLKLASNLGWDWYVCYAIKVNFHVPHHRDSTVGGEAVQYPIH